MSDIKAVKKNVQFQELLKENNTKSIMNNEYLIPDTHPDVKKVLLVEARPIIINKEILSDKIMVEGRIEYSVVYIPRDENMEVNSVNYVEKFTNYLDNTENEHKIVCDVDCKIEHIEARVMNERKIGIEAVANLIWEVNRVLDFDFVEEVDGGDQVQVLKKTEAVNRLASSKDINTISKAMLRVGMDRPEISKIIKCNVMLHKKEIRLSEDKVTLGFYCKINILYVGADSQEVIPLEEDVYVSKEEEMIGVSPNMMVFPSYRLENIDMSQEPDDLGENRIINIEALIKVSVRVFSNENIDIIEDAYSTKVPIELSSDEYRLGVIDDIKSAETIVRDNIHLSDNDAKPDQIILVTGNDIITNKTIDKDKIIVEGVINVNVMYKTGVEDENYNVLQGEIPFTAKFDINGADSTLKAIAKSNIESIEGVIEVNTIAIKATLIVDVKISSGKSNNFITDIKEADGEVPNKKASISIYVVGDGDTLWKLAKKYCTTVDDIIKINNIEEPETITKGEKILIPGRADF